MLKGKAGIVALCTVLLFSGGIVRAYEVETHVRFSQQSAACSALASDMLMSNLGLKALDDENAIWQQPILSQQEKFNEWKVNWIAEYADPATKKFESTIKTLIGWGAKFEDEETTTRPANHFFDPLRSAPLLVFGIPSGVRSPDWALEDSVLHDVSGQDNSLYDALDHIRFATSSVQKSDREAAWQDFFQDIGMVIHHLQDMSQPQHVRNDDHCDGDEEGVACWGFHNPSYYEKYTNEHRSYILPDDYGCNHYPVLSLKKFHKARDYWTNEFHHGEADYTNRNFVSQGTNFYRSINGIVANRRFPFPDPQNGGMGNIVTHAPVSILPPSVALSGDLWFLGTYIYDNYTGNIEFNERSSTFSLWDDKLEQHFSNVPGLFVWSVASYNYLNFEAAYPFLIPRTIAYSAGLINYFFRGRIQVTRVVYRSGNDVTLTVTNTTAEENPGNAPFTFSGYEPGKVGRFYLYQDEADGTRWEIPPANVDDVELTYLELFQAGQSLTLVFDLSAVPGGSPDFDLSKPLTLVYDGLIGEERGVAVASFELPRLLAFDVSRATAGAHVPNIVDVYRSLDSGGSWQMTGSYSFPYSDTTDVYGDRLKVQAVTYVGRGEVLLWPDYRDYIDLFNHGDWYSSWRLRRDGAVGATGVNLDFNIFYGGNGVNISDLSAQLRSITYTGGQNLTALRVQHPPGGSPPQIRSFQLLEWHDWDGSAIAQPAGAWTPRGIWGEGGLPELSWRGGDDFALAVTVECSETSNPCPPSNNLHFYSALRHTTDYGASYADLASFDGQCAPNMQDVACVQHIIPLDKGRLLGWITQDGADDPGPVELFLSVDGGLSWSVLATVPQPAACVGNANAWAVVDEVLYLGTGRSVGALPDQDYLFVETRCTEKNTYTPLGVSVFVTTDSGQTWTEAVNPPHQNGRIIFAGDNQVVPGRYAAGSPGAAPPGPGVSQAPLVALPGLPQ